MAHTTVKISQLPSASHSDITSATAVLPIIDGDTTKQITVDDLFGTATHITASGNVSGSATSTGSFGLLRASNIGGNSPLIISDVTEINFGTSPALRGNPIFHGDINILSQSFILDAEDNQIIGSNDQQGAAGLITFGGVGAPSRLQGLNIQLGASATQHVTASGNISASGVITAEGLVISDDASITDNLTVGSVNSSTHVTASGNISASGTVHSSFLRIPTGGGGEANEASIYFGNSPADKGAIWNDDTNLLVRYAESDIIKIKATSPRVEITGDLKTYGASGHITASGNISASGDITANNLTLSGDATINGNLTFGNSISDSVSFGAEISSSIIPDANNAYALGSSTKRWSSIFAHSSSFNYISASTIDVNADTIRIGGTSFSKTELDNLKSGKSISTTAAKQVVHQSDDTTFVQMKTGAPGRVIHKVSNVSLFDMQTSSLAIGSPANNVPVVLQASSLSITGSTSNTGSFEQSGSSTFTGGGFVINDLLNLLANYGSVGLPTGSGAGNVSSGDINLDGQVNVNDLLLILGGMGNPNIIPQNLTIPNNVNHQLIGPEITVSQSIVVTVGTNSFLSIT